MATCGENPEIFNRALETFQIDLHLRILGATLETVIFSIAVGLNAFRDYRDRLFFRVFSNSKSKTQACTGQGSDRSRNRSLV